MKLYTGIFNHKEEILISFDNGFNKFLLKESGIDVCNMNELILHYDWKNLLKLKENLKNPVIPEKILSPIPHPLQDIICLGINYDEHAKEAGKFSQEAFGGDRPYTIYFSKRAYETTGDWDKIPSYEGLVDSLDYESELGVILGKDAKNVAEEDALDFVFGYTIINDISARNLQTRHKQWYYGKSLDGFTPMGPCIVTPDEIIDVNNLEIGSKVNGEKRQLSNTKFMIKTVAGAIAELSQGMTLKTGTIIATGTPAGVGMGMNPPVFLKAGDQVSCFIENIGTLTNIVE